MEAAPSPDAHGISIIIPAHNEANVIGRTLDGLLRHTSPSDFDVVVVPNGCTDSTAAIAESYGDGVRTVVVTEPSKHTALMCGLQVATQPNVVLLDADIDVSPATIRALVAPLFDCGVLATAPQRSIARGSVSIWVRWYYDVWERLPQVRTSLFGRGVIALAPEGVERVAALPPLMSDDLAISDLFAPDERAVVDASVVIRPPRTMADLLRRKVRSVTGNTQADRVGARRDDSKTSVGVVLRLALDEPRLVPKVAVFLTVSLVARLRARRAIRRADFTTWQRDESSRTIG
jgi:glycosyltransferase involved in cell wall biosynthesis